MQRALRKPVFAMLPQNDSQSAMPHAAASIACESHSQPAPQVHGIVPAHALPPPALCAVCGGTQAPAADSAAPSLAPAFPDEADGLLEEHASSTQPKSAPPAAPLRTVAEARFGWRLAGDRSIGMSVLG
jgi:hypothetical protein